MDISIKDLHLFATGKNDNAVSWFERNASSGELTFGGFIRDGK